MHHQTRKVSAPVGRGPCPAPAPLVRHPGRGAWTWRLVAATLLCGAAFVTPAAPAALVPLDEAGFERVLKASKGQVVLVNFWATWCAPCREEMPALVKLEAKLRNRGFRLLTVSADEPEQETGALQFLQQQGVRAPAYIKRAKKDEDFINAIDQKWVGALPASFLYDRAGRKVRSFIGEVSMSELEAAIRKLL